MDIFDSKKNMEKTYLILKKYDLNKTAKIIFQRKRSKLKIFLKYYQNCLFYYLRENIYCTYI